MRFMPIQSTIERGQETMYNVSGQFSTRDTKGGRMKEYIEREVVSEGIRKYYYKNPPNSSYQEGFDHGLDKAQRVILNAPAADVAPVVRCKDCKYYAAMVTDTVSGDMETATWGTCRQPWFNSYEYDVDEDGFCNCGARMDKEEV